MKAVIILWIITIAIAVVGWQLAYNRNDVIESLKADNERKDEIIKNSQAIQSETESIVKELQLTKQKLKESKKNETCDYILSFDVRAKCLQNN